MGLPQPKPAPRFTAANAARRMHPKLRPAGGPLRRTLRTLLIRALRPSAWALYCLLQDAGADDGYVPVSHGHIYYILGWSRNRVRRARDRLRAARLLYVREQEDDLCGRRTSYYLASTKALEADYLAAIDGRRGKDFFAAVDSFCRSRGLTSAKITAKVAGLQGGGSFRTPRNQERRVHEVNRDPAKSERGIPAAVTSDAYLDALDEARLAELEAQAVADRIRRRAAGEEIPLPELAENDEPYTFSTTAEMAVESGLSQEAAELEVVRPDEDQPQRDVHPDEDPHVGGGDGGGGDDPHEDPSAAEVGVRGGGGDEPPEDPPEEIRAAAVAFGGIAETETVVGDLHIDPAAVPTENRGVLGYLGVAAAMSDKSRVGVVVRVGGEIRAGWVPRRAPDPRLVPPGTYRCIVLHAYGGATARGEPMWCVTLVVIDGPQAGGLVDDHLPFSPAAMPRTSAVLRVLGVADDARPEDIIGRVAEIRVVHEIKKTPGGIRRIVRVPWSGFRPCSALSGLLENNESGPAVSEAAPPDRPTVPVVGTESHS